MTLTLDSLDRTSARSFPAILQREKAGNTNGCEQTTASPAFSRALFAQLGLAGAAQSQLSAPTRIDLLLFCQVASGYPPRAAGQVTGPHEARTLLLSEKGQKAIAQPH